MNNLAVLLVTSHNPSQFQRSSCFSTVNVGVFEFGMKNSFSFSSAASCSVFTNTVIDQSYVLRRRRGSKIWGMLWKIGSYLNKHFISNQEDEILRAQMLEPLLVICF